MEIRVFPFLIVTERDSPLVGPGPESRSWCAPVAGAPVQANLVTGNWWKNKHPNRFIQYIQQSECNQTQTENIGCLAADSSYNHIGCKMLLWLFKTNC